MKRGRRLRSIGDRRTVSAESEVRLLKVPQVAERLGLGTSQVWEMVKSGELDSLKIGHARRIRSDVVDAYIKRLTAEQAERRTA
jgi:excisionase family DNA binding protein